MANGIKCGLQPCFNYMFGSTVGYPSQRVIGRSGRHERMERAVLVVYKNVSAAS